MQGPKCAPPVLVITCKLPCLVSRISPPKNTSPGSPASFLHSGNPYYSSGFSVAAHTIMSVEAAAACDGASAAEARADWGELTADILQQIGMLLAGQDIASARLACHGWRQGISWGLRCLRPRTVPNAGALIASCLPRLTFILSSLFLPATLLVRLGEMRMLWWAVWPVTVHAAPGAMGTPFIPGLLRCAAAESIQSKHNTFAALPNDSVSCFSPLETAPTARPAWWSCETFV